jgi:hypothetical protein
MNMLPSINPFDITKASDLSDEQIESLWVDIPGEAGFLSMVNPASPMPMFILGGKGSGKTHLMRYLSFPLQRLRHAKSALEGIRADGYLGVYLRCDGLNAARFVGKGVSPEQWRDTFAYSMELWFAQLTLGVIQDLCSASPGLLKSEPELCTSVLGLLDAAPERPGDRLSALSDYFRQLQRQVDIAVNNSAASRRLDVQILASPGRLMFGIPALIATAIPALSKTLFLYLVDEVENLSLSQQRYINTLVRERSAPCTLKIGARLYGIKTTETYSDGEHIVEGSEYDKLFLDEHLRRKKHYPRFARLLLSRRLSEAGFSGAPAARDTFTAVDSAFEFMGDDAFADSITLPLVAKYQPLERPYFRTLRNRLTDGLRLKSAPGLHSPDQIATVTDALAVPSHPLLEKLNILLFYKAWNRQSNLQDASHTISRQCSSFLAKEGNSRYKTALGHFKGDLLAQLLRETGQRQRYIGLDTFIAMSQGFPRNLLIILKHVYKASVFNGEAPFRKGTISLASQHEGVTEASLWFFEDARAIGDDATAIRGAITRLATLFRDIRFADKPSECSLIAFSCDPDVNTPDSSRIIELTQKWSLLIAVPRGQRDRNTRRVDSKYQLNSMLAPRWDLPIGRRGTLALSPLETAAIFDPAASRDFAQILHARIKRMMAPLFGRHSPHPDGGTLPGQKHLPF